MLKPDYAAAAGTVQFNGTNDFLSFRALGISGARNRSFFTEVDVASTESGKLFSMGPNNTGTRWTVNQNTGALRIEIQGSGHTTGLSYGTSGKHFVGCVLEGTTLGDHTLYLDGASEAAAGTMTVNTGDAEVYLGRWPVDGDYFGGGVAWALVIDRALTAAEIAQLRSWAGY